MMAKRLVKSPSQGLSPPLPIESFSLLPLRPSKTRCNNGKRGSAHGWANKHREEERPNNDMRMRDINTKMGFPSNDKPYSLSK